MQHLPHPHAPPHPVRPRSSSSPMRSPSPPLPPRASTRKHACASTSAHKPPPRRPKSRARHAPRLASLACAAAESRRRRGVRGTCGETPRAFLPRRARARRAFSPCAPLLHSVRAARWARTAAQETHRGSRGQRVRREGRARAGPEGALENSCGKVRVDEDVVRQETRPLLHGVEEHAGHPLQAIPPGSRARTAYISVSCESDRLKAEK